MMSLVKSSNKNSKSNENTHWIGCTYTISTVICIVKNIQYATYFPSLLLLHESDYGVNNFSLIKQRQHI